jgi:hypothetical protein
MGGPMRELGTQLKHNRLTDRRRARDSWYAKEAYILARSTKAARKAFSFTLTRL